MFFISKQEEIIHSSNKIIPINQEKPQVQEKNTKLNDKDTNLKAVSPSLTSANSEKKSIRQDNILNDKNYLMLSTEGEKNGNDEVNALKLEDKTYASPMNHNQKLIQMEKNQKKANSKFTKIFNNSSKKSNQIYPLYNGSNEKLTDERGMMNTKLPDTKNKLVEHEKLNNESMVDLLYEKNQHKTDYDEMIEYRKKNHPSKFQDELYSCSDVLYKTNTGRHTACGSSTPSDFDKFGVGIALYFKFTKHLLKFFIIAALLSLPALIFNIFAFKNVNPDVSADIYSIIQASTIGSIGLGRIFWKKQFTYFKPIVTIGGDTCALSTTRSTSENVSFYCPNGPILSFSSFTYGIATKNSSCDLLSDDSIMQSCNNINQTSIQQAFGSCAGKQSCILNISSTFYNYSDTTCAQKLNSANLYFKANCENNIIFMDLFFGTYEFNKQTASIIMTSCDACIIILLIALLYYLKKSINVVSRSILKSTYSASSYTVEIKNLPKKMEPSELAAKLWKYLEDRINPKGKKHAIVDLQIVLPPVIESMILEHGRIITIKNDLMYEFYEKFGSNQSSDSITFIEIENIANSLKNSNDKKSKEAISLLKKIRYYKEKKAKLEEKIEELDYKTDTEVISAYVTFNTKELKQKTLSFFSETYIARFFKWLWFLFMNRITKKHFEKKLLGVYHAEDPSNILWENLGLSFSNRLFRKIISYTITIILWCATCALIISSTNLKKEYTNNYPVANCKNTDINSLTLPQIENDYNLGAQGSGYLECYCTQNLSKRINEIFPNGQELCHEWLKAKLMVFGVMFISIFGVLVINMIMQQIFGILSKFERHQTVTEQLGATAVKIFFAQFLNTGLLILILNNKFDIDNWLFQGIYSDITPLWYKNIGSTIILTMLINAFSVPTSKAVKELFITCFRLCDRGCTSDMKRTKKKTQKAYNRLYIGSEFLLDRRYAQVMNVVFVCFLYSSGIPGLYITTCIDLLMNYYIDKWICIIYFSNVTSVFSQIYYIQYIVLRRARNPNNYNQELELKMRNVLLYIIFIHLSFAIWNFGNPFIFQKADYFFINTDSLSFAGSQTSFTGESLMQKMLARLFQKQNIVLAGILSIALGFYIIKQFVLDIFIGLYELLFKKDNDNINDNKTAKIYPESLTINPDDDQGGESKYIDNSTQATYIKVLTSEDLSNLIRLNKVTLDKCENEGYRNIIKEKIKLFNEELDKKKMNIMGEFQKKEKFIGLYTYDLRENPLYKEVYQVIEEHDKIKIQI